MARKGDDLLCVSLEATSLARRQKRQGHQGNLVSDQQSVAGRLRRLVFAASDPEVMVLSRSPRIVDALWGS